MTGHRVAGTTCCRVYESLGRQVDGSTGRGCLRYVRINCDISSDFLSLEFAKNDILKKGDNSLLECNSEMEFLIIKSGSMGMVFRQNSL